ncbi:bifunctional diguanylate cyclase/phosphodiesterase [Sphingomonas sp. S-NIH.Pt15_0812]|jgi:diguanylate cyclase (GGDEF)-like protein|uniref:putative bifunctional diguanylate cyclase/phosphodiesterase n=1 Tax=Sphingomonas sp. S-NIH.Pt15_0812 TaxID=1920129 RepID=UPI001F497325|nr:bifunctional diguanylate cyclase/phosphodiesterase [Sphingomonas sp. S-NIH.Pt15_0812]
MSLGLIVSGLDLIPVPAVIVVRETGTLRFPAFNRAFRLAGLGVVAERSPLLDALGDLIHDVLDRQEARAECDWTVGEAIDCRYYRVTIARSTLTENEACVITLIDQTSQYNTERSLRREMTTDSLTGLPNREGFSDIVEAAEQPRQAVMVIDLARFGRVNACLGGLVGDELLITVARRLRGALRANDVLARIGGNEFAILLTIEEEDREAHDLATRVMRTLSTPFRLTDFEISVDCSIGMAFTATDAPREELIRHAQFATKRAKATGRIEAYQNQAFAIAREQFGMETALRRAIERGQLRLAYQPIRSLATGALCSFEALVRWTDEEGVHRMPDSFIPVAEESGLIVPLGRWAIDEAARTLAEWDRLIPGNMGRIAVNLSAIQLQRDAIAPVLRNALDQSNLTGDRFTLELTESAIVSDPDRITGTMHALRALGATLAMDDFGTGYSNLAYLQKLPIDVLKIDRSFVTGMIADRDKIAIVRAILSLAQALGMQTTAEGIETQELAQTLAVLGCTYGQGYFYARPLEAPAALAMLAEATESAI